ncbi:MAG: hypothetical protein H6704_15095 [Myxococcales bacterium]|nr:hypothetical protein [Myxococcales bacterium]
MRWTSLLLLLPGLVAFGCDDGGDATDDGGGAAAVPRDAGPPNGRLIDAHLQDARPPRPDLGPPIDAGPRDAGERPLAPDAGACQPGARERCNGEDDDCDGTIDEGFDIGRACLDRSADGCARTGTLQCVSPARSACVPDPDPREQCNGRDDDCDGAYDEGFALGEACEVGVGVCVRAGVTICLGPDEVACGAVPGPPEGEVCNGLDDDCDGVADEELGPAEGIGAPCTVGVGACTREGTTICPAGGGGFSFEGIREDLPEADVVRGGFEPCFAGRYDDNQALVADVLAACDGDVLLLGCRPVGDDTLHLAAMGARADVLFPTGGDANTTHAHNGVAWYFDDSHSWGFAPEGARVQLNSCDTSNEQGPLRMCWHTGGGRLNSGYRCGDELLNGNGQWERVIFQREGTLEGVGLACDVEPGEPVAETCNARDDDCDEAVDEDTVSGRRCDEGVGLCEFGLIACDEAGVERCEVMPLEPATEVCNGVDDDCNGITDDVPGLDAVCAEGLGICAREGVQVCSPVLDRVDLDFAGVRRDLPVDDVVGGGFVECYRDAYNNANTPLDVILDACPGDVLLTACAETDAPRLAVAAMGAREDVLRPTGRLPGGTHEANGVAWYFSDDLSWGFAPAGAQVERRRCDIAADQAELRMCWHTRDGRIDNGARCGNQAVGGNDRWQRVIYARAGTAGDGLLCDAAPAPVAVQEACDGLDDDCDGLTDEDFPVGDPCAAGVGACRVEGALACDATGAIRCDAEPTAPEDEQCNGADDDCDGRFDEGLECPAFVSCRAAQAAGNADSGVYRIATADGVVDVYCDLETDGGGWTLVGSTATQPPDDVGGAWHPNLATLSPGEVNLGLWDGLVRLGPYADVRFACRPDAAAPADAPMAVDFSVYGVPWYADIATAATDADSCFAAADGRGRDAVAPARRDNLSDAVRERGTPWSGGERLGEDTCDDVFDFAIDFDDLGHRGNPQDGTDWGESDGVAKCGDVLNGAGQWFVFARERPEVVPVDGVVALIGLPDAVADALAARLVRVEALAAADVPARLAEADVAVGVLGDPTELDAAGLAALDAFNRRGGGVLALGPGVAPFGAELHPTLSPALAEVTPLGFFDVAVGGGDELAPATPVRPVRADEPVFTGVARPLASAAGTARFATLFGVEGRPTSLRTLATFPGDGSPAFPEGDLPAVALGARCGGSVVLAPVDLAPGVPDDPDVDALLARLVARAAAVPPPDLPDVCPRNPALRPRLLLCGEAAFDLARLAPEGARLEVDAGCAPDADAQALIVTPEGLEALDLDAVTPWLEAGGQLIATGGAGAEVHLAVFDEPGMAGALAGTCGGGVMPPVRRAGGDAFWRENRWLAGAPGGCGGDLAGLAGVTALGGWDDATTSLAYRDLGEGRVWFVATDWAAGGPDFGDGDLALLRTMVAGVGQGGLYFEGYATDLPLDEVERGGFEVCWQGGYGEGASIADILAACDGDVLMMACRPEGAEDLRLAAMGERDAIVGVEDPGPADRHPHNGVDWYFSPGRSWGFAPEGLGVQRNTCDTQGDGAEGRLCWHTGGGNVNNGWRCGADTGIGRGWERLLLQRRGPLR